MAAIRLQRNQARVLVVDIQERLLPSIFEHESVIANAAKMLHGAKVLNVPVFVSEQYKKGLGETNAAILHAAGEAPRMEKMTFSCCGDAAMRAALCSDERRQVILVGIETHVCVQQTVLDLVADGFQPVILADAVGSRRPLDRDVALDRMRQAGAIVTTVESAIFELTHQAGTVEFKQILSLVR